MAATAFLTAELTAASAFDLANGLKNFDAVKYDIATSQCFVAGTLVLTIDGDKPIEEIKAGDFVYSTNPETGESEYKEVVRAFRKESDVIIHIFVNGEEIETTPSHPFWVEDKWVAAKDLREGDILTLADGTTATITKTYGEQLDEPVIVYNFEVQDFHTYYVTDVGVLVHNNNDCITANVETGEGYDAGDPPVRIDGDWSINDMKQALLGHPPKGLGSPDIHHGGQMPGGAKHEIIPPNHRNNPQLHQNRFNQGVTAEMRTSDRQLHWWYRAREQGADQLLPDWIYD